MSTDNSQHLLLCANNTFLPEALSVGNPLAIMEAGRLSTMFDKDRFAELLSKAKGDRSINQYGQHCDVDPGYISRLLRGLRDQPPSAEVINKLASRAYNGVTVEELMAAAGYLSDPTPINTDDLPQTVAPYLADGLKELTPEARKEVMDFIEYVRVKYAKKDGDDKK
jgi:transcriptional regulator with XRE-family HTH domain